MKTRKRDLLHELCIPAGAKKKLTKNQARQRVSDKKKEGRKLDFYKCQHGNHYHLTSRPERQTTRRKDAARATAE